MKRQQTPVKTLSNTKSIVIKNANRLMNQNGFATDPDSFYRNVPQAIPHTVEDKFDKYDGEVIYK